MSKFTMDLYKIFAGDEGNVFMSPYSVCVPPFFSLTSGQTEEEIRGALGLSAIHQTHVHVAHTGGHTHTHTHA